MSGELERGPYPEQVWARFVAPRMVSTAEDRVGSVVANASTPAAALRLQLWAKIAGQRVERCRFLAYGCPYTIAVGDWLAQWCEGRELTEIQRFSADKLRQGLEIPEERAHCWLMAQDLLRDLTVKAS